MRSVFAFFSLVSLVSPVSPISRTLPPSALVSATVLTTALLSTTLLSTTACIPEPRVFRGVTQDCLDQIDNNKIVDISAYDDEHVNVRSDIFERMVLEHPKTRNALNAGMAESDIVCVGSLLDMKQEGGVMQDSNFEHSQICDLGAFGDVFIFYSFDISLFSGTLTIEDAITSDDPNVNAQDQRCDIFFDEVLPD